VGGSRPATELRVWAIASAWALAILAAADLARGPDDTGGGLASVIGNMLARDTTRWVDIRAVLVRLLALAAVAAAVGSVVQVVTWVLGFRPDIGPDREDLDYGEPAELEVGPDEPWEVRLDRLVTLKQQGTFLDRARPGNPADRTVGGDAAEPSHEPGKSSSS